MSHNLESGCDQEESVNCTCISKSIQYYQTLTEICDMHLIKDTIPEPVLNCSEIGREEGVFDNILEVASNVWIWTREGGSAWCFSGPLKRIAYSRIDQLGYLRKETLYEN